jgi:hypothetical protein
VHLADEASGTSKITNPLKRQHMAFGLFNKKKKDEPHYDPTNIGVEDLRKGFVLDYDLKSWEVVEEYEYDWGNEEFSYEYKISNADGESRFLNVERDDNDDLFLAMFSPIRTSMLDEEVEDRIFDNKKPPREIIYKGTAYYREEESMGFYKNVEAQGESAEFISWTYYDEGGKRTLSITKWDDEEFDASVGDVIKDRDISNILPGLNED